MKFQLFALLLVVAGACAMPSANDNYDDDEIKQPDTYITPHGLRFTKFKDIGNGVCVANDSSNQLGHKIIIDDLIRRLIELLSKGIKKAGLDPLVIKKVEIIFPKKPCFFNVKAFIENLKYVGASNIKINSLDYSVLNNKLSFDFSLPELSFTVDDSGFEVTVFKNKIDGQLNGSLITESIRLSGEISVSLSVIEGIHLRNVSLKFSVGGIKSDLRISARGNDYSAFINTLLDETIPNALKQYEAVINKFLEDVVKAVFFIINII